MELNEDTTKRRSRKSLFLKIGIPLVVIAFVGLLAIAMSGEKSMEGEVLTTGPVTQGDLIIDVLESGSLEAKESQVIKSEVEGQTTIISLIPEGTILSATDVENGRVLAELDSSDLREKAEKQVISVQSASATYTDAKESYTIQEKQNESNLKAAQLKVKFAKMDLEKYVGSEIAALLVEEQVSVSDLIGREDLGGEALQKERKLLSDIDVAGEEVSLATDKLNWTRQLEEKGYETADKLRADELALKRQEISKEQARTAQKLFTKYEFPKETEKLLSDYQEAVREQERTVAKCRAEIAKAEARLTSNEMNYMSEKARLDKLEEQIEKCTIRATKPGLVVYAGGEHYWRDDRIEEGAQIRERQDMIKIPNTDVMLAKTKVHESMVAKVKED